ncbi:flavodoxin domain-containing protein [Oscillibacter sp.]|uniref:flavodoxin domain-containing protein n=1 Tax=Oscillibacter sp. TaxID=1945593 RepID=UPI0028963854|nr:flavodoxin domain-containing protein [Oscillibacter sp.]
MTLIIYAGKYRTTQRYAEWIAEKTGADLRPVYQVTSKMLRLYDTVVYGGAIYGGAIQGVRFLKKHLDELKQRGLILFTVGLTMPGDEVAFRSVLERNLSPVELEGIRAYHFLGAIQFKKLNGKERMMMWLLKSAISKKQVRSQVESDLLECYNGELDYANEAYVDDLVKEISGDARL